MSDLKASAIYSRTSNGTKPKSKVCRLTPSLIPSLVGNTAKRTSEATESSSSSPSKSSTSPRRTSGDRKSPRRHAEERQQAHHSPKRSPRRFLSFLDNEPFQNEMGLGFRVSSTTSTTSCVDEPGMSFLEFETLYTLEKELMQSRYCSKDVTSQLVDDKRTGIAGWFDGRRGVYTELPDPVCQIGAAAPPGGNAQFAPTEVFSFAPGWSLNADHFYQWQHRGKTTQQVLRSAVVKRLFDEQSSELIFYLLSIFLRYVTFYARGTDRAWTIERISRR